MESLGILHVPASLSRAGTQQGLLLGAPEEQDTDALLATCYALAMQALYLGESVSELLILLRGCHVILAQQWPQRLGTAFHRVESYCQLHEISERTNVIPVLHPSRYNPAIESFDQLRPLCTDGVEKKVFDSLYDVVQSLAMSPRQGTT